MLTSELKPLGGAMSTINFSNQKTIRISPEELVFNGVVPRQTYSQMLVLQNTLSAPVEIVSLPSKI